MCRLHLRSEPIGPDGALLADGFGKLLGAPSLELLEMLVREALQNVCDATRDDGESATVKLRVRTLTGDQRKVLRENVFTELPAEAQAARLLHEHLEDADALQVLEIADYGTTGLAGPSRADQVVGDGENADFVNFFRNVGAIRDVKGGGGTYGYGKATLYTASLARAIVVDTSTTDDGRPVRRFMAAQIGRSLRPRFTGRHWWGVLAEDGNTVDPLQGPGARRLAERLGMPERPEGPKGRGTTIMILAPLMPADPETVVAALTEYVLWNFWPRLMATAPRGKRLEALVAHEDSAWEAVPSPETFAPVALLCRAMNALREGSASGGADATVTVKPIECLKPMKELGRLAIARGPRRPRKWLLPPAAGESGQDGPVSIIPDRLHHVALMRPAQLVVRYEVGPEGSENGLEWGGVFMCSEEEEVEVAFASSEPPAHNDWRPESLPPRSRARRFVNVALRRIRESLKDLEASATSPPPGANVPLARAATALGRMLPGAGGDGAGPSGPSKPGGGAGKGRPYTQPRPHGLRVDPDGRPFAEFLFDVRQGVGRLHLEASPAVVIDGRFEKPDEATGIPEVLEWVAPGGSRLKGSRAFIDSAGSWIIRVSVPGDVAVGLRLREPVENEQ